MGRPVSNRLSGSSRHKASVLCIFLAAEWHSLIETALRGELFDSVPNVEQKPAHTARSPNLLRNHALICSVALVVCALSARPFVEMGINDDFTYIRSALCLAQTGQIAYFGWGSVMLGWQLYLGALFIKLFGFSFTAVRFSGLLVAAATVYLLHRILVRCGISETNATMGTLTFALSPLFLPLAFSFMTDVPGLLSLLLCLYLCLRALQTATDIAALNWLILAAISNVLSGTVRQTSWLGVIVIVPSTLWLLRKRRVPWVKAALVWLISLLCIYLCIGWFQHQPHVDRISLIGNIEAQTPILYVIRNVYHFLISVPLFLLPVLVAFISPVWVKTRRSLLAVSVAITFLAAAVLAGCYLYLHHPGLGWLAPWGSNYVTPQGLIDIPDIGVRPTVLGPQVRIIVSFLVYAAVFACAACIASVPGSSRNLASTKNRALTGRELAILLAPFTIAYLALLLPRGAVGLMFDRYLLPLLVVALIIILRLYQERVAARLPAFSVVCLFIFAAYSVAALHDLYSMERARLAAANELLAAGISRTAFYGGIEYDGWTQIDSQGYVIAPDPNLSPEPQAAPLSGPPSNSCDYGLASSYPSIQPDYALSFDVLSCDGRSRFAPLPYRTWLPPFSGFIYIQAVAHFSSER
jgi:hypothetical protein